MPDPERRLRPDTLRRRDAIRDRITDRIPDDIRPRIDLTRAYVDGIFQGGGTLGTAYVGSLLALDMHRIWFKRVAGTSAGAITAAMVAAGYRAHEIAWLSGPEDALGRVRRPALPEVDIPLPIRFTTFVDPPETAADIMDLRQQTDLWQALRMRLIDDLREIEVPVPTREPTVDGIADTLLATYPALAPFRNGVEDILRAGLGFLPATTPTIGDFRILPTPAALRRFADTVWAGFADEMAWYPPLVNLLYAGGFARGDVFHDTIRQLVGAKVRGDADANVTMGELPLHLTVIGANTARTSMEIYSSTATPEMPVADAVRASMAIPFFFEPFIDAGEDIVDGGMFSNYPFWLYTGGSVAFESGLGAVLGDIGAITRPDVPGRPGLDVRIGGRQVVTNTEDDRNRPKLGLLLDEMVDPPEDWDAPAPRLADASGRGLRPSHRETLERQLGAALPETPIVDRLFAMVDVVQQRERVFNVPLRAAARTTSPLHEAEIPLRGFDWLDFELNEDPAMFASMGFRGWEAVVRMPFFQDLVPDDERKGNPFAPGS